MVALLLSCNVAGKVPVMHHYAVACSCYVVECWFDQVFDYSDTDFLRAYVAVVAVNCSCSLHWLQVVGHLIVAVYLLSELLIVGVCY